MFGTIDTISIQYQSRSWFKELLSFKTRNKQSDEKAYNKRTLPDSALNKKVNTGEDVLHSYQSLNMVWDIIQTINEPVYAL